MRASYWFGLAGLACLPSLAAAQTPPAGANCAALAAAADRADQNIADLVSEGLTDNSAPRAQMRAAQEANELLRFQIIVSMMQAQRCALPRFVPNGSRWLLAATACRTARMRGGAARPPECDRNRWMPEE